VAGEVPAVRGFEPRVEIDEALDPRDRDEEPPPLAADLALDPALLVGPLLPRLAVDPAGDRMVYDHVVEQSQVVRSGFSKGLINSPANLAPVATQVNQQKANYYSTKQDFSYPLTVRDWLTGQSFEAQLDFGLKTLKTFLGGSQ
jgi:hypothetical protein